MSGCRLRAASLSDAALISRLHGESFARAWSASEVEALLAPPGAALVASSEDSSEGSDAPLAGFLIGRIVADEAEILSVTVAPANRRRGVGRRLVRAFEDAASAQGARRIFLEVAARNGDARALYRGCGFQEAGLRRGYYAEPGQPPDDAIVMVLDLAAVAGGPGYAGHVD